MFPLKDLARKALIMEKQHVEMPTKFLLFPMSVA